MIDFLKQTGSLIIAGLVVLGAFLGFSNEAGIGAARNGTSTITNPFVFTQGVTLTGDGSTGSKTFTVTSSNTATSTITGGCFQFYATSTATAHKFQASTTPGIMYSQYGTCPNL